MDVSGEAINNLIGEPEHGENDYSVPWKKVWILVSWWRHYSNKGRKSSGQWEEQLVVKHHDEHCNQGKLPIPTTHTSLSRWIELSYCIQ